MSPQQAQKVTKTENEVTVEPYFWSLIDYHPVFILFAQVLLYHYYTIYCIGEIFYLEEMEFQYTLTQLSPPQTSRMESKWILKQLRPNRLKCGNRKIGDQDHVQENAREATQALFGAFNKTANLDSLRKLCIINR